MTMNDKAPIQNLEILRVFREELRQYLDDIVALNWRTEGNRFVLALCDESRNHLNVDIAIDAGHSLLPVFSADTEVPDYASSRYRECRVAHVGHAVMLVQDIIDRYGLDNGSVRNGCFCFFRSDAMKEKVEALRRSNGWLVCGNFPEVGNIARLPSLPETPDSVVIEPLSVLLETDFRWREGVLFRQAAGYADEIELEILRQQQPGLRFWDTAKLDYPTVVHYLHWDSHDRGALLLDAQYNSCLDLMDGLEKTEPDFVFSVGAGGENKAETIQSFIQEVYQKLQAGAQARKKIVL
jgi:hypothetical protein